MAEPSLWASWLLPRGGNAFPPTLSLAQAWRRQDLSLFFPFPPLPPPPFSLLSLFTSFFPLFPIFPLFLYSPPPPFFFPPGPPSIQDTLVSPEQPCPHQNHFRPLYNPNRVLFSPKKATSGDDITNRSRDRPGGPPRVPLQGRKTPINQNLQHPLPSEMRLHFGVPHPASSCPALYLHVEAPPQKNNNPSDAKILMLLVHPAGTVPR